MGRRRILSLVRYILDKWHNLFLGVTCGSNANNFLDDDSSSVIGVDIPLAVLRVDYSPRYNLYVRLSTVVVVVVFSVPAASASTSASSAFVRSQSSE